MFVASRARIGFEWQFSSTAKIDTGERFRGTDCYISEIDLERIFGPCMRKSFVGRKKRQFMKYDILFSILFVIPQLCIFSFFFLNYGFDEISYVTCGNVA